ncbi:MAG: GNAT family N-acetyltransferase [Lachnospiraceae bacterium]
MLELVENTLTVEEYLSLRSQVHWKKLSSEQASHALAASLLTVKAYWNGQLVGMGRIVGDGAVVCYIQDLIMIPEVQGHGIGSALLKHLIKYVEGLRLEGTEMMLDLMCAKGREPFYEAHGFISRPTDELGPGMIMYLQ